MRVKHTVQVQISQDADQKRKLYSDDATSAQTDTSGYTMQSNSLLSVEPSGLENLAFGDVTLVRGLYLEVDKEALVRVNGAADPVQLRIADGATKAKLLVEAEITQVTVENPSADVLSGVYVVWGLASI
jgi:hypothetical protein